MKQAEIESTLRLLIERSGDQKWLTKLLSRPAAMELYASLANEVHAAGPERSKSLMVTSAIGGEGRSTIALLMSTLAAATDASKEVLLVDADFTCGTAADTLGVEASRPGLSEYFDDSASFDEILAPTALENFHVVRTSAGTPTRILLSPTRFEEFMNLAHQRFAFVVVDTPAGSANKDVLSIAGTVGQTVIVVRYGYSSREQISALAGELERIEAPILGTIMNRREYVLPRFLYGK